MRTLRRNLDDVVRPLLREPWTLDVDTTIKPLYGQREGAVVSDNPKKPGRPSHACHSSMMAGTRLVLGRGGGAEMVPGHRTVVYEANSKRVE